MKKKLTVISLAAVAAAGSLALANTTSHRQSASERAGAKPGVSSGSGTYFAGSKPGVSGGANRG
jgi:hypothetical protein